MQQQGRHVLSHAAVYLVARGLPGVVAFLAIPLFTRLLDPAEYGRYALVAAAVSLLNALLFQWLRLSLVRYLPVYQAGPARFKSTLAAAAAVLIVVLGAGALAVYVIPAGRAGRPVAGVCWVVLATQAIYELCCEYARATIRPWYYMGLQLARLSAAVGLGAVLVILGAGWWGPLVGSCVGMGAAVAYAYTRDWRDARLSFDREVLRRTCRYGLPLSLTVALAVVVGTCDRFLIAWFLGEESAGLYSVAYDFAGQTITLLMMVVQMAVFPLAVRAFEHDGPEAAGEHMRSNASLLLAVGFPCFVGLAVLAPGVAGCFLGRGFRSAAAGIIPLVALGTFLAGLKSYHFDAAFQFADRTIYQVWIVLVTAVVNLALNLAAIPLLGINGAALASALAYVVSIAITAYVGRRHFKLPFPGGAVLQVLGATTAMALLLYPLRDFRRPLAVAAEIAAGASLYGLILVSSNFFGLRDYTIEFWRRARARGAVRTVPAC